MFFFERFSLLFQGFWGFGRAKKSLFLGGFPCRFPKEQGKEGQSCFALIRVTLTIFQGQFHSADVPR